jgi:hypothetical protein
MPEFWADYQWTLRLAVESQRMNKATVMRQLEKSLPRMLSLLSCIQFVAEIALDAVNCPMTAGVRPSRKRGPTSSDQQHPVPFGNGLEYRGLRYRKKFDRL